MVLMLFQGWESSDCPFKSIRKAQNGFNSENLIHILLIYLSLKFVNH